MEKRRGDFDDIFFRDAAADSLLCAGRLLGQAGEYHDEEGLIWVSTGIPFGDYNGVIAASLSPEDAGPSIRAVLEHFRRLRLPISWVVDHRTRPENLGDLLVEAGFVPGEPLTGMGATLERLPEATVLPPSCQILEATTPGGLRSWLEAAAKSFDIPTALLGALFHVELRIGLGGVYRRWVLLESGVPVACATLLLEGVPGIYFVGVAPEARRRGYGYAVTRAAMAAAREAGHDAVVLQASPSGERLYRTMGFRTVSTIRQYEKAFEG